MCTRELRLVLVSLLIGWKSGAITLNQSLSEVMQNQSNYLITFDTQLKTTLFWNMVNWTHPWLPPFFFRSHSSLFLKPFSFVSVFDGHCRNLVPRSLFSASIVVETMEAEKRDPGNEVAIGARELFAAVFTRLFNNYSSKARWIIVFGNYAGDYLKNMHFL